MRMIIRFCEQIA